MDSDRFCSVLTAKIDAFCLSLSARLKAKSLRIGTPISVADGSLPVTLVWRSESGLDVFVGEEAQGAPATAEWMFDRLVFGKNSPRPAEVDDELAKALNGD